MKNLIILTIAMLLNVALQAETIEQSENKVIASEKIIKTSKEIIVTSNKKINASKKIIIKSEKKTVSLEEQLEDKNYLANCDGLNNNKVIDKAISNGQIDTQIEKKCMKNLSTPIWLQLFAEQDKILAETREINKELDKISTAQKNIIEIKLKNQDKAIKGLKRDPSITKVFQRFGYFNF